MSRSSPPSVADRICESPAPPPFWTRPEPCSATMPWPWSPPPDGACPWNTRWPLPDPYARPAGNHSVSSASECPDRVRTARPDGLEPTPIKLCAGTFPTARSGVRIRRGAGRVDPPGRRLGTYPADNFVASVRPGDGQQEHLQIIRIDGVVVEIVELLVTQRRQRGLPHTLLQAGIVSQIHIQIVIAVALDR